MPTTFLHESTEAQTGFQAFDGGSPDGANNTTYHKDFDSSLVRGANLPDWKRRLRAHLSATTALSGVRRRFHYGDGEASMAYTGVFGTNKTVRSYGPGVIGDRPLVFDPYLLDFEGRALSDAKIAFLQNIKSTYQAASGGTILGELRETIHLLKHPAQALRQGLDGYYRTVKKRVGRIPRGKSRTRSVIRTIQDTWLENVFGWRPLVNDIEDVAKALAFKDYRQFVPVSGHANAHGYFNTSDARAQGTLRWNVEFCMKGLVSVRYKGACSVGPSGSVPPLRTRLGLTLSEFVPTVWELIPYSFLVDYFTNIGAMINAAATNTAGVTWSQRTIWRQVEETVQSIKPDYQKMHEILGSLPLQSAAAFYSGYRNECVAFDRSTVIASNEVGTADFHFRCPGVSSTKWLNIAALAKIRSL